jgi:putative nucleotidyltransferase-like protein
VSIYSSPQQPSVMNSQPSRNEDYISLLSSLIIQGYAGDFANPISNLDHLYPQLEHAAGLSDENFSELLKLADMHHVIIRALRVLERLATEQQKKRVQEWCRISLDSERSRISKAVEGLYAMMQALDGAGCRVSVIKSLDHWPDAGCDLDLYTSGTPEQVTRVMCDKLQAHAQPRSWGDRLAHKWNFQVPGLAELVEIHVRYLGQTGEQTLMASRVLERSVRKSVNAHIFPVPAPEEQILISTLQRMYRHFYFRLCDMADVAALIGSGTVDFEELHRGAELGGIWPGVASFLVIVAEYIKAFGGRLALPREVTDAACSLDLRLQFRENFLRLPLRPAVGLYGSQLLTAGKHRDLRAMCRLPLLPPLAVSALIAYRLTGSGKGVW